MINTIKTLYKTLPEDEFCSAISKMIISVVNEANLEFKESLNEKETEIDALLLQIDKRNNKIEALEKANKRILRDKITAQQKLNKINLISKSARRM